MIIVQKSQISQAAHIKEAFSSIGCKYRLAILASHPIQYQAPLFRAIAANPLIDLTVFFYSDWGLKTYRDEGFGHEFKWDIPLLEGYRSEFLPNLSHNPSLSRFWGIVNPSIVSRLLTGNFDAVWIHGWANFTNWLAMFAAFSKGIPVLLRGETNLLPLLPRWKGILKRLLLRSIFRLVSAFLAIGRYNDEFYQAYGVTKEKIFHVPYTVDNDLFLSKAEEFLPKKAELKQKLGIPPDWPIILFSGKLSAAKRPMDLLKAYAQIAKDVNITLLFVGDGPHRGELEARVQEYALTHVYFLGFQNQTELPKAYAVSDIFVLPSSFEPWGLVVNEAMCFGLPVIVSDKVGAGGDLVFEGVNGFIYPSGNIALLEKKLRLLLGDTALREKMGNSSSEIIKAWNYSRCVEGVLDCLRKITLLNSN